MALPVILNMKSLLKNYINYLYYKKKYFIKSIEHSCDALHCIW